MKYKPMPGMYFNNTTRPEQAGRRGLYNGATVYMMADQMDHWTLIDDNARTMSITPTLDIAWEEGDVTQWKKEFDVLLHIAVGRLFERQEEEYTQEVQAQRDFEAAFDKEVEGTKE